MFTWLIVVEGLISAPRLSLSEWLWAENIGTVMRWAQLDEPGMSRGPVMASATLIRDLRDYRGTRCRRSFSGETSRRRQHDVSNRT